MIKKSKYNLPVNGKYYELYTDDSMQDDKVIVDNKRKIDGNGLETGYIYAPYIIVSKNNSIIIDEHSRNEEIRVNRDDKINKLLDSK